MTIENRSQQVASGPRLRAHVIEVVAPAGWINSNQRLHRMQSAKLTAAWREAGRASAGLVSGEPCAGPVHIFAHVWKPRGGRYDPNNLWPTVKAVVDGFVEAGFLVDDDHVHVVGPDIPGRGPMLELQPDGRYYCHDYLKHNWSAAEIEEAAKKNQENGKLGGRPRKEPKQ